MKITMLVSSRIPNFLPLLVAVGLRAAITAHAQIDPIHRNLLQLG